MLIYTFTEISKILQVQLKFKQMQHKAEADQAAHHHQVQTKHQLSTTLFIYNLRYLDNMFPFPIIATLATSGFHFSKHLIRKTPKPFHAFAYGGAYATGTNVLYNMSDNWLTSWIRQPHKYVGRPQYLTRL
jgi:hypothetical protein